MANAMNTKEQYAFENGLLHAMEVLCLFNANGKILPRYREDTDLRKYLTPEMRGALATRDERRKRAELDALAEKLRAEGYTVTEPGKTMAIEVPRPHLPGD